MDVVTDAVDAFDLALVEQLAVLEACDALLSPHSGFGFAASCVGTPWATISGGRWPEYFFNGVPFRSVLPDPRRYPCYTHETGGPDSGVPDRDGRLRTPSMSIERVEDDLDLVLSAVEELVVGAPSHEQAMSDFASEIVRFWSMMPPNAHPSFGEGRRNFSIDEDLQRYLT